MSPRHRGAKARVRRKAALENPPEPAKKPQGNKTKCTPEITTQIAQFVAAGAPLPLACEAVGIPWTTAGDWIKPGHYEREPYYSFAKAVEQARAVHGVACAMRITKAGKRGEWQADQGILDRRFPEFYRPQPPKAANDGAGALDGLTPGQILDIALAGKKESGTP